MKKFLATAVLFGLGVASAQAVSVRYFLSQQGLSDAGNTDSASVVPANAADPDGLGTGAHTLYLWAQIGTGAATDLKGFNLQVRSTGDVLINSVNIWQNNFVPAVTTRWNASGVPGITLPDATGQFADPSPSVAVLEAGVTNGAFAAFDDQWQASVGASLVGSISVTNNGVGDLHIINQGSGFLQTTANQVFLGFDDTVGNPLEVIGQPYDTASPEASFIPEPTSLMLLGLAALGLRRR